MIRRLLELGTACGLAIAQPIFDLVGRNPEFLVAHRLEGAGLVFFALGLAVLPALLLWFVEALVARAAARAVPAIHGTLLALLFAATALAPLQRAVESPALLPLAAAAVIGTALALAITRSAGAARILGYGSLALPVLVALFLLNPEVRGLVLATPSAAGPEAGSASDTPVLVVVLDALPLASILDEDGEMEADDFPHLAALAQEGVWFRNATTNSDFTVRAIPALLSGRLPTGSPKAHLSEYPDNLFTMLGPSHEVVSGEAVTALCPPHLDDASAGGLGELISDAGLVYVHAILPRDLRDALPPIDQGWRAFGHGREGILGEGSLGRKIEHIDRFVARLGAIEGTRPHLAVLHAEIPHRPYGVYASGKYYSSTGREPGGRVEKGIRIADEQVAMHAQQRHLLQARYADRRLGEILDTWRGIGVWERSVIVVTSDHGVSFRPGERARHLDATNQSAVLPVPLLVKLPGGAYAGEVRDENVELIDVVPMVAAAAGIAPGFEVDGQDPFSPAFTPRPTKRAVRHAAARISEFAPYLLDGALARARERIREERAPELYRESVALVGQPVAQLRQGPAATRPFAMNSPHEVEVAEADRLLPGEVFGFVGATSRADLDRAIAVTVDGIVAAVTRPYRPWAGQAQAPWYALLPEEMLAPGMHRIEAWLVSRDAEGLMLRPPSGERIMPSYLGIPLGQISYLGVQTTGILEGKPRAESRVEFVVPMRPGERARTLDARIEALDPESTVLRISVNGARVFDATIDPGVWRQHLTLPPATAGEPVRIEILGEPQQIDPTQEWTFGQIEVRLGG